MEETRIHVCAIGIRHDAHGEAPILAHASCDFVKAMTYPWTALSASVTRVGRRALDVVRIEKKDEPVVIYATGRSVIAGTTTVRAGRRLGRYCAAAVT